MRKNLGFWVSLGVLALLVAVGTTVGQQQISGGGSTVLSAGSALVGKVGIDQTTAGTTNAVSEAFIGSTAIASGNGVAGAGAQRVTIASDNTAFSVNATLTGGA